MGANPNTFSASFAEYWSRRMQRKHDKIDVYRDIASFEEKGTLKKGQKVHRPYTSDLEEEDMGADGSYTTQAITDTDEYLTIAYEKDVAFYIKELDEIQHNYSVRNKYADQAAVKISNGIDANVQAEAAIAAAESVDDGDLGGTDNNGITLTVNNVLKVLNKVSLKMNRGNIEQMSRWGIPSPDFLSVLNERLENKDSKLGDEVGERGKIGFYGGNRLHLSNNQYWTGKLLIGTTPTANDTVVINGVTFKFVDTGDVDAAGEVYYGANAGAALDNLVASINAPGTSVAGVFTALSAADQKKLKGITATDGATYLTIAARGKGYISVSETLTAAADVWTPELQIQHNIFGQDKPIDVVIQRHAKLDVKDVSGKIGKDFVTWTAYGIKVFNEGTYQLVDVKIRTDQF